MGLAVAGGSALMGGPGQYGAAHSAGIGSNTPHGHEEITTIFIVGFPDDMTERELNNMFLFARGFEAATLKVPAAISNPGAAGGPYNIVNLQGPGTTGQDLAFGPGGYADHELFSPQFGGPNSAGLGPKNLKNIIGFAKFRTRAEALAARDALNGRKIDAERGCVVKTEMAKKNLHTKQRVPGQAPPTNPPSKSSSPPTSARLEWTQNAGPPTGPHMLPPRFNPFEEHPQRNNMREGPPNPSYPPSMLDMDSYPNPPASKPNSPPIPNRPEWTQNGGPTHTLPPRFNPFEEHPQRSSMREGPPNPPYTPAPNPPYTPAILDMDALSFIENSSYQRGYNGGHDHGRLHGTFEGRQVGREKGYEMWDEVGYYEGVAQFWQQALEQAPKELSANNRMLDRQRLNLSELQKLITAFPQVNRHSEDGGDGFPPNGNQWSEDPLLKDSSSLDITALLKQIRTRFKITASLLGIPPKFQNHEPDNNTSPGSTQGQQGSGAGLPSGRAHQLPGGQVVDTNQLWF
ncbi:unnamed protein product [Tilletia laevis]|nr:unnamed protein product [Tilletia laevis]